ALRVRPDHALAHHLRGEALLKMNRWQDAERAFGACLAQGPAAAAVYRGRGEARLNLGNLAGAIEDYTQSLALTRDADSHARRGWAYFFADAWRLAQHDFDEAVRLDPDASDARVGRGLARVMLGDYRRAVADADAVLRRDRSEKPETMHNIACLFA